MSILFIMFDDQRLGGGLGFDVGPRFRMSFRNVIKDAVTAADREKMLSEMTRAEKAELLRWIVRDLGDDFPGIESKPDVMGGVPCITRTRIPVWVLEQARRLGTSDADLLRDYPTLTVQDLANAWNFVRSHRSEIDAQIEANETAD